uniref:Protein kinase domain-containing protein n=1 Tax=Acrobeloides nanus TaxID=290746 RepID=A0A914EDM8_9BILA
MGGRCSRRVPSPSQTQLSDFSIVRSIGRGAFGKVCIVRHRGMKKLYALKYMAKRRLVQKTVAFNILRELELLQELSHPFIVNLWFTFQDDHYIYMVSDLLLGGDLRYHLNEQGRFSETRTKLYICEIALAIDYLHSRRIVHRDVKPENILLDEQGHAHLTDFNLATKLGYNELATSFTGTRPYMAPEILMTSLGEIAGYDHRVDWWSLGVCLYEMLRGLRPFEFPSSFSSLQVMCLIKDCTLTLPANWTSDLVSFIGALLNVNPDKRVYSLRSFSSQPYMNRIDMENVLARKTAPVFVPKADKLNCDPTYELEERIIESSPLHRHRHHKRHFHSSNATVRTKSREHSLDEAIKDVSDRFKSYNRFKCDESPWLPRRNSATHSQLVNQTSQDIPMKTFTKKEKVSTRLSKPTVL